jgi:hypothetical protein
MVATKAEPLLVIMPIFIVRTGRSGAKFIHIVHDGRVVANS